MRNFDKRKLYQIHLLKQVWLCRKQGYLSTLRQQISSNKPKIVKNLMVGEVVLVQNKNESKFFELLNT